PRRIDEVIDAREENKQPVPPVLQRGEGLADIGRIDRHPGVAGADASVEDQVFGDHCRGVIPWALIRSCRIISALSKSSGRGGQPGMRSEEHTSELHHVAISYAVFCLKKKINNSWLRCK